MSTFSKKEHDFGWVDHRTLKIPLTLPEDDDTEYISIKHKSQSDAD